MKEGKEGDGKRKQTAGGREMSRKGKKTRQREIKVADREDRER